MCGDSPSPHNPTKTKSKGIQQVQEKWNNKNPTRGFQSSYVGQEVGVKKLAFAIISNRFKLCVDYLYKSMVKGLS